MYSIPFPRICGNCECTLIPIFCVGGLLCVAGRDRQSSDGRLDACAAFSDCLGSPLGASPLWPEVRDCRETDNCTNCGKRSALLKSCARERSDTAMGMTTEFVRFFKG